MRVGEAVSALLVASVMAPLMVSIRPRKTTFKIANSKQPAPPQPEPSQTLLLKVPDYDW